MLRLKASHNSRLHHHRALDFSSCTHPALRDYEAGYVKEGVGAGELAIAAGLAGLSNPRLVYLCDQAMDQLQDREGSGPSLEVRS